MANKYMKKCSTPSAITEMQINTSLRFHLASLRMASTKNTGEDMEGEKEP
jgi:hypothetical protein